MKEKLNALLKEKVEIQNKIIDSIKEVVTDRSLSLDERWNFFLKMGDVLDPESWIQHFECFNRHAGGWRNGLEDKLYDFAERHERVYVETIADQLQEYVDDNTHIKIRIDTSKIEEIPVIQEDVDNFKEECMRRLIYSFEFDW